MSISLEREVNRLIREKQELREALRFAIGIIGHPDDSGTKMLEEILKKTAPQELPEHSRSSHCS
jgi:hypothetical protein